MKRLALFLALALVSYAGSCGLSTQDCDQAWEIHATAEAAAEVACQLEIIDEQECVDARAAVVSAEELVAFLCSLTPEQVRVVAASC